MKAHSVTDAMSSIVARKAAGESDAPDVVGIHVRIRSHEVSRPEPE